MKSLRIVFAVVLCVMAAADARAAEPLESQPVRKTRTRNILLVTTDGLRWQEVFVGADPALVNKVLGETDEFAHMGRYDQYLRSAHRYDSHLRILWETVQTLPDYRGATTLIVTTDHGRGDAPVEWKGHGAKIKGSERIWIGVFGPDTPALGERTHVSPVTQSQVAATLASFLGLDFRAAAQKAAPPIDEVLRR